MKRGKTSQFLVASILDTLQLNSILSLSELSLDKIVKVCLYNSYKNAATFISLARVVAKTDKNYYVKTENAILIDATLIKKSWYTNNIKGDSLLNCLNTSLVLAGIEIS